MTGQRFDCSPYPLIGALAALMAALLVVATAPGEPTPTAPAGASYVHPDYDREP